MTDTRKNSHFIENMEEYISQIQLLLENIAFSVNPANQQESANPDRHSPVEDIQHERHLSELLLKIDTLHPADFACILEAIPLVQRMLLWESIKSESKGKILIAASGAVRESLITTMSHDALLHAVELLDSNEISNLSADFPQSMMRDLFKSRSIEEREQLRTAMSFTRDTVGTLMDFDVVTIRKDATVESVLRYLRRLDNLPAHTDQLFVVDRDNIYLGTLPLSLLLVNEPEIKISTLMNFNNLTLHPDYKAQQAAQAFERYALASVPVLDEDNKLLGRVSISSAKDFIRAKAKRSVLNLSGLHEEEDIFSSVWKSAKNRWMWLSLNLCFAFFASRVISGFEDTIVRLVALAALMPIVAIVAVSSANQTATNTIHSLALGQITDRNVQRVLIKELAISLLNGIIWGSFSGIFAYLLYKNMALGLVIAFAMLLSLILGALVGIVIPLTLHKFGRYSIFGSNILLAAITTSGSFFIFLELATLFLGN